MHRKSYLNGITALFALAVVSNKAKAGAHLNTFGF
jgi:hypothetical protein